MAWTDQCKHAFKTNAEVLLWKRRGKKGKAGIMRILKELSEESDIPTKTLYHWWNELENEKSLKTQTNEQGAEKVKDNTINEEVEEVIPTCNHGAQIRGQK